MRRRLKRLQILGGTGLAISLLVLLELAAGAESASLTHPFQGSFGPDGTAATSFESLGAIAVDQSTGDVFVANNGAGVTGAIYKFGADHEPSDFSSTGTNSINGLTLIASESQIAIDPATDDIYVTEDRPVNSIKKFLPNGEAGTFAALGSSEITGFGPGEAFGEICGVAIDSSGDIYASDFSSGIHVFAPSGELITDIPVAEPCNVAVDSRGVVYVRHFPSGVEALVPSQSPVTAATVYTSKGFVDDSPESTSLITVDPATDDLYVDESARIAQYDKDGNRLGSFGEGGSEPIGPSAGVAVNGSSGQVYVASGEGTGKVALFGPSEPLKASVDSVYTSGVGQSEATLHAEVDPSGAETSVSFEYGPGDCALVLCSTTPPVPIGSGVEVRDVAAVVGGLTPNATYHLRVVIGGEGGPFIGTDHAFRTAAAPQSSAFEPADGRGFELVSPLVKDSGEVAVPSNRSSAGGLALSPYTAPERASVDGEAVTYASFTAFGAAHGAPAASQYISTRGSAGWTTQNVTPPDRPGSLVDPLRGFSADLRHAAVVVSDAAPQLAPNAPLGVENLYVRDNGTGSVRAVLEQVNGQLPATLCVNFEGASPDFQHVLLSSNAQLTEGAPVPSGAEQNLYEWSPTGGLELVSVLTGEGAAEPSTASGFGLGGTGCQLNGALTAHNEVVSNDGGTVFWTFRPPTASSELLARIGGSETVQLDESKGGADPSGSGEFWGASADGGEAFFTDENRLTAGARPGDLYEFDLASRSLVDITSGGSEAAAVLGVTGVSEDGSYVYFVAKGDLTGAAQNSEGDTARSGQPNLYVAHGGSIDFIAKLAAAGSGVPGDEGDWVPGFNERTARVSPDGRALAFLSIERLTGFDNAIAGSARACRIDGEGNPVGSPGCDEAYLFEVSGGKLVCASCNPSGARPVGPARTLNGDTREGAETTLTRWTTPFEQPRYLSDDGSRVYFESFDALAGRDTNGRRDVYEFERSGVGSCDSRNPGFSAASGGCVLLVTTGTSDDQSFFLDASGDGSNAFVVTRQALVAADEDERYDVYDARVGGGFAPAPPAAAPCAGEACRPSLAAPSFSEPGSARSEGRTHHHRQKRCVNRRRKGGKRAKGRCAKSKPKKRSSHKGRSGR